MKALRTRLISLVGKRVDFDELLDLYRSNPQFFSKFNPYQRQNGAFSHLVSLVSQSIELIENHGVSIRLIEGSTQGGDRIMRDIDLCWVTADNRIVFADMTKTHLEKGEYEAQKCVQDMGSFKILASSLSDETGIVSNRKYTSSESKLRDLESKLSGVSRENVVISRFEDLLDDFELITHNPVSNELDIELENSHQLVKNLKTFADDDLVDTCFEFLAQSMARKDYAFTKKYKLKPDDDLDHEKMTSMNNSHVASQFSRYCSKFKKGGRKYKESLSFYHDALKTVETKAWLPFPYLKPSVESFESPYHELDTYSLPGWLNVLSGLSEKDENEIRLEDGKWLKAIVVKERTGARTKSIRLLSNFPLLDVFTREKREGHKTCKTYEELERKFSRVLQWSSSTPEPYMNREEVRQHVEDLTSDCETNEMIKAFLAGSLSESTNTNLMSYYSCVHQICVCISKSYKKLAFTKGGSSKVEIKKGMYEVSLSIENVKGRKGVVLSLINQGITSSNDTTFWTIGDYNDTPEFCVMHSGNPLDAFTMTVPDMNWYLLLWYKSLSMSVYSMGYQLSQQGTISYKLERTRNKMTTLWLMSLNDPNFSQSSEKIRYCFVNATGISNGCLSIFEDLMLNESGEFVGYEEGNLKIEDWKMYKPRSNLELLYMNRMCKMTSMIEYTSVIGKLSSLKVFNETTPDPDSVHRKAVKFWKVVFPGESIFTSEDGNVYNSFYTCKMMSMERNNPTLGAALITEKQLKNRDIFNKVRLSVPKIGEARQFVPKTKQEYVDAFKESILILGDFGLHRPNAILSSLMTLYTIRKHCGSLERWSAYNKDLDLESSFTKLTCSDILNNRGSTSLSGENGINPSREMKKGGRGSKGLKITQKTKSYEAIMKYMHDVYTNAEVGKVPDLTSESKKRELQRSTIPQVPDKKITESQLKEISMLPTELWPCIIHTIAKETPMMMRVFTKPQVGVREIAIMSGNLKVLSAFLENNGRMIRDKESTNRDLQCNLIECRAKNTIVLDKYKDLVSSHRNDKGFLVFDNADCSKWGPSQNVWLMHICCTLRNDNEDYSELLKSCFKMFTNKISKLPDAICNEIRDPSDPQSRTAVGKLMSRLVTRELKESDISLLNQYLLSSEGMAQGILGVLSSCLQSDVLTFTNDLTARVIQLKHDMIVSIRSYCTSDDYIRMIYSENMKNAEYSVHTICDTLVGVLTILSNAVGIKRNTTKSVLTEYIAEFNSMWMTLSGVFEPEVKSTLSYIDYPSSLDPSDCAIHAMSLSKQYVSSGGSIVVGAAIWIILNIMAIEMCSTYSLRQRLRQAGSDIYDIPLEFGGIVKPDLVYSLSVPQPCSLIRNYWSKDAKEEGVEKVYSILTRVDSPELLMKDSDEADEYPRFLRSRIINMNGNFHREKRQIQQFLASLEESAFLCLTFKGYTKSMLTELISALSRETTVNTMSHSCKRLGQAQVSNSKKLLRINTMEYEKVGLRIDQTFSRKEMDDYVLERMVYSLGYKSEFATEKLPDYMNVDKVVQFESAVVLAIKSAEVQNPHVSLRFQEPRVLSFTGLEWDDRSKIEEVVRMEYLPMSLGGRIRGKIIDYVNFVTMYTTKLYKMMNMSSKCVMSKSDERLPYGLQFCESSFFCSMSIAVLGGSIATLESEKLRENSLLESIPPEKFRHDRNPEELELIDASLVNAPNVQRIDLSQVIESGMRSATKIHIVNTIYRKLNLSGNDYPVFWRCSARNLRPISFISTWGRVVTSSIVPDDYGYTERTTYKTMEGARIVWNHTEVRYSFRPNDKFKPQKHLKKGTDVWHPGLRLMESTLTSFELKAVDDIIWLSRQGSLVRPLCQNRGSDENLVRLIFNESPDELFSDEFLVEHQVVLREGAKSETEVDFYDPLGIDFDLQETLLDEVNEDGFSDIEFDIEDFPDELNVDSEDVADLARTVSDSIADSLADGERRDRQIKMSRFMKGGVNSYLSDVKVQGSGRLKVMVRKPCLVISLPVKPERGMEFTASRGVYPLDEFFAMLEEQGAGSEMIRNVLNSILSIQQMSETVQIALRQIGLN